MEITVGEMAGACRGRIIRGACKAGQRVAGLCIDTRGLEPGFFFTAVKGANADGHSFIGEAFRGGAAGALISRGGCSAPAGKVLIRVGDTVNALEEIASFYRAKFNIPFVGITGSSGKTSSREMTASILRRKFRVLSSPKNYNNRLGLPLTLFRLDSRHGACVLEMGMSAAGEISSLAGIARPDTGLITNVGPSHLENFGSLDMIARAKAELLPGLKAAALNRDDGYFEFFKENAPREIRTFGSAPGPDFYAENIITRDSRLRFLLNGKTEINLAARGMHNVMNALSAIAVSSFLGADEEDFSLGLAAYRPPPMRLELKKPGQISIIDDSYNANPQSLAAAGEVLAGFEGRKVFVMGDMLELGADSDRCHEEAGRMLAGRNFSMFFACGVHSQAAVRAARKAGLPRSFHFPSRESLIESLLRELKPGDAVLVKGSRSSGMDKVVGALEEKKF